MKKDWHIGIHQERGDCFEFTAPGLAIEDWMLLTPQHDAGERLVEANRSMDARDVG